MGQKTALKAAEVRALRDLVPHVPALTDIANREEGPKDRLLQMGEVLDILGCSARTVDRAAEKGLLVPVRIGANGIRKWRRSEVLALLHNKQDNE